jgi:hypothetical protein
LLLLLWRCAGAWLVLLLLHTRLLGCGLRSCLLPSVLLLLLAVSGGRLLLRGCWPLLAAGRPANWRRGCRWSWRRGW